MKTIVLRLGENLTLECGRLKRYFPKMIISLCFMSVMIRARVGEENSEDDYEEDDDVISE